jgi:ribA/ribD-fused uncharacterized protein
MMYHKALTFKDTATAKEIMLTSSPRKCKALGGKAKGFDANVWDAIKQSVVEQGSYYKYTRGVSDDAEGLKRKLLATGERELVEASHFDRVWGVGFSADQLSLGKKGGAGRDRWGQNFLGKALMNTRVKIREEEEAKLGAE